MASGPPSSGKEPANEPCRAACSFGEAALGPGSRAAWTPARPTEGRDLGAAGAGSGPGGEDAEGGQAGRRSSRRRRAGIITALRLASPAAVPA